MDTVDIVDWVDWVDWVDQLDTVGRGRVLMIRPLWSDVGRSSRRKCR